MLKLEKKIRNKTNPFWLKSEFDTDVWAINLPYPIPDSLEREREG